MKRLKSYIYKIGYPLMRVYWYIIRPETAGVRCVIVRDGKVLLVRHTYGSLFLTVVGGGIKKNETPKEAVIREVCEEVGLELTGINLVGIVQHDKEYKRDTIHVFLAKAMSTELRIDNSEIAEADWYSLDEIPSTISPLCRQFLELAVQHLSKER